MKAFALPQVQMSTTWSFEQAPFAGTKGALLVEQVPVSTLPFDVPTRGIL